MMRSLLVIAVLLTAACQGEKPGDRCDEFFQNTCKSPMSCVDMGDKKVCAGSCDSHLVDSRMENYCEDESMEPVEVEYEGIGSAGCHCLPKQ